MTIYAAPSPLCLSTSSQATSLEMSLTMESPSLMKRRIPGLHQKAYFSHPSLPSLGCRLAPLSPPLALQTLDPLFLQPPLLLDHLLNCLGHLLALTRTRKRTRMPPTHTSTPLPPRRDSDDESETGVDTPPSIESNSNAGPTPRRPRVIGVRGLGKGRARGRGRGRGRGRASRSRSPLTTSSLPMGRGRGRGRGRGGCLPPTLPGSRVRNPVYGPLIEENTILAGPWLKRESEGFAWRYSGPTPGPSQPVDTSMSASELFARYFTDEVWQLIVDETNRYAASCRQNLSDHSRPWTPVTVADIKAFIGMVILMGIVKSPQLDLYWSTKHHIISRSRCPRARKKGTMTIVPVAPC